MPGKNILLILSLSAIIMAVGIYAFYFLLPSFGGGSSTAKPVLMAGEAPNSGHVQWIVSELGAGKLGIAEKPAVVEIYETTFEKYFVIVVDNGKVTTAEGRAINPDIRISGSVESLKSVLDAQDCAAEVNRLYGEGKISLEILKDTEELAAKGYQTLYSELAA